MHYLIVFTLFNLHWKWLFLFCHMKWEGKQTFDAELHSY